MPSAESIQDDKRFVGLFVGRSGHGKSTAAYSFPHPIKVLDVDGRIRGGLACDWVVRKGIDYVPFPPVGDKYLWIQLNQEFETILTMIKANQFNYQTLVLDSITFAAAGILLDTARMTKAGEKKGNVSGGLVLNDPGDYRMMYTSISSIMGFLKSLPIPNIIVTAHITPKWGKAAGADDYDDNVIIGEQLLLPDKIAEVIPGNFDHVFKFRKHDGGAMQGIKYFFSANGDLARSAYNPRIPYGEQEIKGSFYDQLMGYINKP